MYKISDVRNALVEYFQSTAEYRERFVVGEDDEGGFDHDQYKSDRKNSNHADALKLLVEFIGSLPDDDPTLKLLAGCDDLFTDGEVFEQPQNMDGQSRTNDSAVHFGDPYKPEVMDRAGFSGWFESWAEDAIAEMKVVREELDAQFED